jgi:hypothetical protein
LAAKSLTVMNLPRLKSAINSLESRRLDFGSADAVGGFSLAGDSN